MFYVNSRAIIERINDGTLEIVIQSRVRPPEPITYELPGGRVEPFESLFDALRREVKEETGLNVTWIEGSDSYIDTVGINPEFEVECVRAFAAYQTIKGPVDSVGLYFRCKAEGTLLAVGDGTKDPKWISVESLKILMEEEPLKFSDVDRAGIVFYLKQLSLERRV